MDVRTWFRADTWRLDATLWVLISTTFVAVLAVLTTPWLALASVGLIVASVAICMRNEVVRLPFLPAPLWLIIGGVVAAYITISMQWSADPAMTGMAALVLALLLAGVHLAARLLASSPTAWLEHMSRTLLVAFIAALLFLLADQLSGNALKRALFWPFQAARWGNGKLWFDPTVATKINLTSIKWSMPPFDFLLWPVLLICALQVGRRAAQGMQLAILGSLAVLVTLSDHKTSMPAMAAAIFVFALASLHAALTRSLLQFLWIAAFLVIVPLAPALYQAELHLDQRVGPTMAARIRIWNYTATHLWRNPVFGVGAGASTIVHVPDDPREPPPPPRGRKYALATPPHAHNIYLQSWYELGAAGTILLIAFGVALLHAIGEAPQRAQSFLLATAATVMITGAASFGLFEAWFMGALALGGIASALAVAYCERVEERWAGQ